MRQLVGQFADLRVQTMRLGYIRQRRAGSVAVDRPHHRDALRSVRIEDMLNDRVSAARTQVGIDVGRRGAGWIEEAFEVQVQPQRVGTGDAQTVRHERGSRRAARRKGHAGFPGKVQDVFDDQEDRLEAHAGDGIQFVIQARLNDRA